MFDLVIKNTILMGLLVLIIHFLVKNQLLEKEATTATATATATEKTPAAKKVVEGIMAGVRGASVPGRVGEEKDPKTVLEVDEAELKRQREAQLKQLYDYVYSADSNRELASLFGSGNAQAAQAKDLKASMNCDSQATVGPSAKMLCKSPIDEHISANAKTVSSSQSKLLGKGFKNVLVLNEYSNESVLNGGALEGSAGVGGFDGFDEDFATL